VPRADLAGWSRQIHQAGKTIVFTNGCFDIIHRGHVEYLAEAALLADYLLIAVNSDASVRDLKGPERPVVVQEDRLAVLGALRSVAALTIFDEPTPLETIQLVRPDILVKGDEYDEDQIVGARFVRENGGDIKRIAMREGRSTTGLIEAIKRLP
jgi:D-glycero-beta-D-manno-heptose 1-phosphate adenylyltransferase